MAANSTFINCLVEGSIDAQVYQDLRQTFARESIAFMPYGNVGITDVNNQLISRVQFTESEISPFHKHDISCAHIAPREKTRAASTTTFAEKKIELNLIQKLLVHAFCVDDVQSRRPYPSAGGLYPIEPLVFLFPERINKWPKNSPAGCYHYRPVSNNLQLLRKMEQPALYEQLLHGFVGDTLEHSPNFAILYLAQINKAIFKYRYRGYRHALMEAGSMYQQATLVAENLGLRTTVWSTFSEPEMMYALGLDHGLYLPLTMQLFGYGDRV